MDIIVFYFRDDYEVSCAELDQLVDIARKVSVIIAWNLPWTTTKLLRKLCTLGWVDWKTFFFISLIYRSRSHYFSLSLSLYLSLSLSISLSLYLSLSLSLSHFFLSFSYHFLYLFNYIFFNLSVSLSSLTLSPMII